jgi:hypothetical protein
LAAAGEWKNYNDTISLAVAKGSSQKEGGKNATERSSEEERIDHENTNQCGRD